MNSGSLLFMAVKNDDPGGDLDKQISCRFEEGGVPYRLYRRRRVVDQQKAYISMEGERAIQY